MASLAGRPAPVREESLSLARLASTKSRTAQGMAWASHSGEPLTFCAGTGSHRGLKHAPSILLRSGGSDSRFNVLSYSGGGSTAGIPSESIHSSRVQPVV